MLARLLLPLLRLFLRGDTPLSSRRVPLPSAAAGMGGTDINIPVNHVFSTSR